MYVHIVGVEMIRTGKGTKDTDADSPVGSLRSVDAALDPGNACYRERMATVPLPWFTQRPLTQVHCNNLGY